MRNRFSIAILLTGAVASCVGEEAGEQGARRDERTTIEVRAARLAKDLIIVDTHIDLPYRLNRRMEDVSQLTGDGDFDYDRARAGGLNVAFMSIYVPAAHQESGDAKQVADDLIDMVEGLVAGHPEKFALVTRAEQARYRLRDIRIGLALGMENGAGIAGRLENLQHFHERGVRYITLAHSKSNKIADSSYDDERQWNGLSRFGREVVAEMNRLGMMIDVSHITDEAFDQVLELSVAPVIATHSSCRSFTPGWERNMSDGMIRKLGARGGVVQINFGSSFLDDDYRLRHEELWERLGAELAEAGIEPDSDHADEYGERFFAENPLEPVDVAIVADHIGHVVELVGIDHVGLGSDFDGVGDTLPRGLEDVSEYPNLIRVLLERGYEIGDVAKICSGNVLRVWTEVERIAGEMQAAGS